jgi:hypothetical protein
VQDEAINGWTPHEFAVTTVVADMNTSGSRSTLVGTGPSAHAVIPFWAGVCGDTVVRGGMVADER